VAQKQEKCLWIFIRVSFRVSWVFQWNYPVNNISVYTSNLRAQVPWPHKAMAHSPKFITPLIFQWIETSTLKGRVPCHAKQWPTPPSFILQTWQRGYGDHRKKFDSANVTYISNEGARQMRMRGGTDDGMEEWTWREDETHVCLITNQEQPWSAELAKWGRRSVLGSFRRLLVACDTVGPLVRQFAFSPDRVSDFQKI